MLAPFDRSWYIDSFTYHRARELVGLVRGVVRALCGLGCVLPSIHAVLPPAF